ncbi:MAG: hypothetical protein H6943_07580 [Zoogloeaceae bacterium]|nr:hypothetical protein [Zoogloeaceae bacterium]
MQLAVSSPTQSASALGTQQLRVQQAQRSAEQAEASARALRQQASVAQREADRAQEGARNLQVSADSAEGRAGLARQQLVSAESLGQVRQGFDAIRGQISEGLKGLDAPVAPAAAPVINSEGQTTGTLVNVTA